MSEALLQNALNLRRAGKLAEAAEVYAEILRGEPRHYDALHALGILCYQSGRLEEAERLIGEAVSARPNAADAIYNRACLLQKLNRNDEALQCFDAAIALKPDYVEALVNRGTLLAKQNLPAEALANFDKVNALRPGIPEVWVNRAGALLALGRAEDAAASCDKALGLRPTYGDAWKLRGRALAFLRRLPEALADFEKATTFSPKDSEAWHQRGTALQDSNRLGEAAMCYDRAVSLSPENHGARLDRANFFFQVEHFEEAAADYRKVFAGDPNRPAFVRGYLALSRMHLCDWEGIAEEREKIAADVREGVFVLDPMGNAIFSNSPEDQFTAASTWTRDKFPAAGPAHWVGPSYNHERIRIAYVSGDFRTHAVASLIAGVFEHQDRSKFETIGVSFGADDGSPMRKRMEQAFDRFIDVRSVGDSEAADILRTLEIDIAVDLAGYTGITRTGIMARRVAPLQVNYLGYPSTMGADYIDYVIGDRTVIPAEHWPFYSEKIVWLPDTYQANDRKRVVAAREPSRKEAGLPEEGFVFCCFNNNHKISPEMFEIWMRLLKAVEGSVLWLLQDNAAVPRNLKREAEARGVAGDRLVFAKRVDPPDHLARQRLAGLFLDTLPYNAHTTASDALWVGLPIVTTPGNTFAGRVAASLVQAAGLPELIAPSLAEYEALALKLARDPEALAAIKGKLAAGRETCALFDTPRIARHLESAFIRMHERHRAGEPPASFAVAPR